MTVPNLITTIRIILTPVFIIYLLDDELDLALIVFAVCVVSDGADGFISRVFNQKSRLGTYLDPLADKILLVTAFITLAIRGFLPAWVTVLVISRDILILLGILVLFLNGLSITIRPSVLSKISTCFQFLTIIAVLSKEILTLPPELYSYLFGATVMFTVSSGLHYMYFWFKIMSEGMETNSKS
jgi:cardiolipin synthase (CMP-forming)